MKRIRRTLYLLALMMIEVGIVGGQSRTDGPTRVMYSQAFKDWRTPPATGGKASKPAAVSPAQQLGDTFIGVNLWHMLLASSDAPVKVRGLKHKTEDPSGTKDWAPVRVPLNEPVAEGDNLRVSVESARKGYLYVVNRDISANGEKSAPTLIFPTQSIRGGNNLIQPGIPIEIPDFQDKPNVFTVERTLPDQTAIQIMLIVSPEALSEVIVRQGEQPLREEQVARWEKQWGTQVTLAEDRALSGKVYTLAEKAAASNTSHPLGKADALPLSLFHRQGHAGEPMLATATIQLKPSK